MCCEAIRQRRIGWRRNQELPIVTGISVMELIQGAKNSNDLRKVLQLVAPLRIVWPSTVDCERALADFIKLRLVHGLGLLDALVASCAIGLGVELCTFNNKHFQHFDGLATVAPYVR